VEFRYVEDLDIGCDLSILRRSTQRHSIILYQHEGSIFGDNARIGNLNNVEVELSLFFEKSRSTSCDLALTPEYSCPWSIIVDIINHPDKWPTAEKLWAIGCESMTKEQLSSLKTTFNNENVYVHFDNAVLTNHLNYVDPLIYLFKGSHLGQNKLIVLLQFKTRHMGVWGSTLERDNLIQGNEIYVLRNSIDSINFLSLICSEAMNFQNELTPEKQRQIDWIDRPYLIFNPQLNPNPIHTNFTTFRKFIFQFPKKEIISLNWNNKTTFNGHSFLEFNSARSGFYIQSDEINRSEQRIKHNHKHGLYYFNLGIKKHAFLLNSSAVVFHIANPSVDIVNAMPQQIMREGPELIETFVLNANRDAFDILDNGITDGHVNYLTGVGCACNFLISDQNCILEKEKLVCLTSGKIDKELGNSWCTISNLFSIKLNENSEVNCRITFTEDTHHESIEFRSKYIDVITVLTNEILPNKAVYPESIADLKDDDLVIGYNTNSRKDNYKYNLLTAAGVGKVATICFLGSMPEFVINKTFNFLQALFDNDNNNKRRVVVFYKRDNMIISKSDPDAGIISATGDFDGPTIFK